MIPQRSRPPPPPATACPGRSRENVPELVEEVRFCLAQQIWAQAETAISRLAAACPQHPELPVFRAELRQGRPSPAPSKSLKSVVICPRPRRLHSSKRSSPAPAPTLNSLAAELDFELGDSFVPAQQPRREPAPPQLCSARAPA